MLKRRPSKAQLFLIIANLLPVYGVWFLGWSPAPIFLVYCFESVIVGAFTLLKIAVSAVYGPSAAGQPLAKRLWSGLLLMAFFFIHYGLFVFVQTTIFMAVTSLLRTSFSASFFSFIFHPQHYIGANGLALLAAFVLGYGFENSLNFILNNNYRKTPFMRLMLEPYVRIFIQQLTVIFGSFILMFGGGKIFILIFALVKIYITAFINYEAYLDKAAGMRLQDNSN